MPAFGHVVTLASALASHLDISGLVLVLWWPVRVSLLMLMVSLCIYECLINCERANKCFKVELSQALNQFYCCLSWLAKQQNFKWSKKCFVVFFYVMIFNIFIDIFFLWNFQCTQKVLYLPFFMFFLLFFLLQVAILFDNVLLRGNRTTKVDSGAFDAFASPNMSCLAKIEINIKGIERVNALILASVAR